MNNHQREFLEFINESPDTNRIDIGNNDEENINDENIRKDEFLQIPGFKLKEINSRQTPKSPGAAKKNLNDSINLAD